MTPDALALTNPSSQTHPLRELQSGLESKLPALNVSQDQPNIAGCHEIK